MCYHWNAKHWLRADTDPTTLDPDFDRWPAARIDAQFPLDHELTAGERDLYATSWCSVGAWRLGACPSLRR